MAETATAHKPVEHKTDKPLSEKEQADKVAAEFNKNNPSTLKVDPPESEVDKLTKAGVEVVPHATAGLPSGGPANRPGMSSGGPVPTKEEVQKTLDENAKAKKDKSEKDKHEKK